MGKCPKCENLITTVNIEDVTVNHLFQPGWKGISYLCPFCNSVLSVQIDPIAVRTDISDHVDQAVAPVSQEVVTLRSQVTRLEQLLAQLLQPRR
ncbi:MAG: hypothetical protein AB1422_11295 [bacterium]